MASIFVTGTDTDVGKTIVTTLLTDVYARIGRKIIPFKPIQTGSIEKNGELVAPDSEVYQAVTTSEIKDTYGYVLEKACSPHLAAQIENITIDIETIIQKVNVLDSKSDGVIVEGAGGLFVPIQRKGFNMIDLIQQLNIPVILVASTGVGTINHTVLSIEAMKHKNIPIAGIIFNHLGEEDPIIEKDNIEVASEITGVPVIGTVPYIPQIEQEIFNEEVRKQLTSNWKIDYLTEAIEHGKQPIN